MLSTVLFGIVAPECGLIPPQPAAPTTENIYAESYLSEKSVRCFFGVYMFGP